MKRITGMILILSMLLVFASCGNKSENKTAENDLTVKASEIISETASEAAEEAVKQNQEEITEAETSAPEEEKLPETKAEILAEYTKIMNQAKKDKPGFTFYEWQTLPDDSESRQITEGKAVLGTVLDIANLFMKDEKKAKEEPYVIGKNSDMYCFPIRDSDYGCLLTDTEAIKTADFKELPNGNYEITIVLNSEKTPEAVTDKHSTVAPSNHGAIFQPLPKKVIDDVLKMDIVAAITEDVEFSYTYHDCKVVVEYEPETNHIITVKQISHVTITGSGRVTLIRLNVKKQEYINEMHVINIEY